MNHLRRLLLAAVLMAGFAPAIAQVPAPVPALPDTERRTSYVISGTTCACNVNFALYGDSTDYQNWVEVFINGVRYDFNDATHGWTITSPSGSLGSLARPITNAVLTFNAVQTGTVQIVGARRPRRTAQFAENTGVSARNLNQVFTDIISQNREIWDKTNDMTGRALLSQPGNSVGLLPLPATCKGALLGFDGTTGLTPLCVSNLGSGNVTLPVVNNDLACFNGTNGMLKDCGIAPTDLAGGIVQASAYGVTCDGVTDDTAALQAAYTGAAGRILKIQTGTCIVSSVLNFNVAGQQVTGSGSGSNSTIIKTNSAAATVIELTASAQRLSNLRVDSSIAVGSRTGHGIKLTLCGSCILDNVYATNSFYGFYGITVPSTTIQNTFASGNRNHGYYFDAWNSAANNGNIDELKFVNAQADNNGASGFYVNGGTNAVGISFLHPISASNAVNGITLNNPDGNGNHAVRDVWITQPEMSGNGAGSTANAQIDASNNTGALVLSIDGGGLIECVSQSGYGIHAGNTTTFQVGNVPVVQCLVSGIYFNGTGGNITGTTFGGNVTQLELGALSSSVVMSGLQGTGSPWGASTNGLKINGGAAAFVATAVDFTTSGTPLLGAIPAGSSVYASFSQSTYKINGGGVAGNLAYYDTASTISPTAAGTGVLAALGINVGSAGAFVTFNGALGSPSSVGTLPAYTLGGTIAGGGNQLNNIIIGASTPLAVTGTVITGNSFVPNLSTIPTNGMYLPAANTLGWAINSAAELQLTSTALSPAADGGNSLGTTALGWQNLFGNTGFVFNIEGGDWVATHTAGILTVGTGDLRVTTAGTNAASVLTLNGTQTSSNKTFVAPVLGAATGTSLSVTGNLFANSNANCLAAGYNIMIACVPAKATTGDTPMFSAVSNDASNPLLMQLVLHGDATAGSRQGYIQVSEVGVAFRNLALQPGGGSTTVGASTLVTAGDILSVTGQASISGAFRFNTSISANGSVGITKACTLASVTSLTFTLGILTASVGAGCV